MWHYRSVYYRDFAYKTRRARMANGSIGDVPAATLAELLSGPMIDVFVGEARRHWSIHRNLLCHHSELLESELEGDGHPSRRKDSLELLEHDPAGFQLLVKWLYQGKLDHVSDMADAHQKYEYAVSCHKLHLLCGRLDMPQLRNVAMDQYRQGLNEAELVPDADEIDDIYRKSPAGSPFRTLMTRVAARQIMDPGSERDVETYRQCFDQNPDFAVDLVKAIRRGTGGMLFEDPTEPGNPCEYHDHHDGPNCHIQGKGRVKHARKTLASRPAPPSTKSTRFTNSDQPSHPHHPLPSKTPRQPLSRQARPLGGTSVDPLCRRLTSPAMSIVGTSPETAIAILPPSLDAAKDREKRRKVTPSERQKLSPEHTQPLEDTRTQSHPAQGEPLPSSEDTFRPSIEGDKDQIENGECEQDQASDALQQTPSRRGIWEWARVGTGRLNIIGRIPHPELRGPAMSRTSGPAINGIHDQTIREAHDDFSIPSTTATEPDNADRQRDPAVAHADGLEIGGTHFMSPSFSQTKRSSDELVAAASSTGSPESRVQDDPWTNGKMNTPSAASGDSPPPTPDTPMPQQSKTELPHHVNDASVDASSLTPTGGSHEQDKPGQQSASKEATPTRQKQLSADTPKSNTSAKTINAPHTCSPHRVLKYKIALAPNLVPPARTGTASF
ncbi:hypothetical protein BDU57DRAFT_521402 [Ampelomyces quisqualis]|uniref:BTB domain-containing protein n=1 Tax=Ampelomyces quisqualis TaxID=50730 RepID=A0A6A5QBR3_AMPQU|nr:hypothetical protein BDU57DRAFT_521402 [Ampelomyces quisqualis]